MYSFKTLKMNVIGLSEYINCVLVEKGVRNAMLLQASDYKENTHLDPIIQKKLKAISEHFSFKQLPLDMGNVLISKKTYTAMDVSTSKKMGDILGYPSAGENSIYSISINAEFSTDSVQIIGMMAEKEHPILHEFAFDALRVLKNDPNVGHIQNVTINIKPILNTQDIIDKLISNIELTEGEIYTVGNSIYNIGFSVLHTYQFDYKNPVHIGIIITLLSYYKDDPIMAFTPLQKFPKEKKHFDAITEKLEENIIHNLNKSSFKYKD